MSSPNTLPHTQSPRRAANAAAGTRRYRSKAQRPCDLCRARKVLCNIPDPARPCQLCDRTGRPCTFLTGTKRRASRSSHSPQSITGGALGGQYPAFADGSALLVDPAPDFATFAQLEGGISPVDMETPWTGLEAGALQAFGVQQDIPAFWGQYGEAAVGGEAVAVTQPSPTPAASNRECKTMRRLDRSSTFIGYSNESDPFLLEHYPHNAADELDFFMVTYRRPSPDDVPAGSLPIHFLQSKPQAASESKDVMAGCLAIDDERALLDKLVDAEMGVALIRLFQRFVFQNLPIISRTELEDEKSFIDSTSPGVLAGMFALALPFTSWDEELCMNNAYSKPDANKLWQISYSCLQKELHFPHLSTVQMCLLLLNTTTFDPVAVESPFGWSLACSMLSISQSLGLHVDPSRWKLPPHEVRLRRRLWWAVVVEHSWRAVTHGRTSMLREDDCNVAPISQADFADESNSISYAAEYFIHLCPLTEIINEICRTFFTLRAVSRPQSVGEAIQRAKPLQQALYMWLDALPLCLQLGHHDDETETPESKASLHMAYFTAHILLFRAILRPIVRSTSADGAAIVEGALQSARDFLRMLIAVVKSLDLRYTAAFWPAYMRHCLCYPGLFCYMLCFQRHAPGDVARDRELLLTWRNVLRARVGSWPLLRFAVVKVDAIFWKKLRHTNSVDT